MRHNLNMDLRIECPVMIERGKLKQTDSNSTVSPLLWSGRHSKSNITLHLHEPYVGENVKAFYNS